MGIIFRDEALRLGLPRYFTGEPCKHGHISERLTKARVCVACRDIFAAANHRKKKNDPAYRARRKASNAAYRRANPDRIAASNKKQYLKDPAKSKADRQAWAAANPDKVREYSRKKRQKDAQKCRDAVKRWAERNPEQAIAVKRASAHNRRARELGNGGSATGDEIAAIRKFQKNRCAMCKAKGKLHLDHIIPLARGGTSFANNLQFLCVSCNQSKAARDPIEWAQSRGALL